MKKLLLSSLFTITTLGAHGTLHNPWLAAYQAASGPLTLGSREALINSLVGFNEGAIIETILQDGKNKNSTLFINFIDAVRGILNLKDHPANIDAVVTSLQDGILTYEAIVQLIGEKRDDNRLQALCGLEEALIKLYQEYAYAYTLPTNLFSTAIFTGIRSPRCWKNDTEQMEQILAELDQLAKVADKQFPSKADSMRNRISFLRNWRKVTAVSTSIFAAVTAAVSYIAYTQAVKLHQATTPWFNNFNLPKLPSIW